MFLINKGATAVTVNVPSPGSLVEIDRMTPYDPTGAGRTLDARDMRIDGRAVAADGTFPGFEPTLTKTDGGRTAGHDGPRRSGRPHPARQYAETVRRPRWVARCRRRCRCRSGARLVRDVHAGSASQLSTSTTATVTSTAGDATLSVTDPSAAAPGRLVNGSFALGEPLQVRANAGPFAVDHGGVLALALLAYTAPASNDAVAIGSVRTSSPTKHCGPAPTARR